MNVKTKKRQVHAINERGLRKLHEFIHESDELTEAVMHLEYAMDDGCMALITKSNGDVVYFDNDDFEKVIIQ
jgi:hypothetical protein